MPKLGEVLMATIMYDGHIWYCVGYILLLRLKLVHCLRSPLVSLFYLTSQIHQKIHLSYTDVRSWTITWMQNVPTQSQICSLYMDYGHQTSSSLGYKFSTTLILNNNIYHFISNKNDLLFLCTEMIYAFRGS